MKVGDRVKTKLVPPSCTIGKNRQATYKHTWKIVEATDDFFVLEDAKGQKVRFGLDGCGYYPYENHQIYKVNGQPNSLSF